MTHTDNLVQTDDVLALKEKKFRGDQSIAAAACDDLHRLAEKMPYSIAKEEGFIHPDIDESRYVSAAKSYDDGLQKFILETLAQRSNPDNFYTQPLAPTKQEAARQLTELDSVLNPSNRKTANLKTAIEATWETLQLSSPQPIVNVSATQEHTPEQAASAVRQ